MKLLVSQILKFALVGVGATALHVVSALFFHNVLGIAPLVANVMAFVVATSWSFTGNWMWTFMRSASFWRAAPRFFALTATTFGINQGLVFLITVVGQKPLWVAMICVITIIPAINFWMSRARIFRPRYAG